MKSLIEKWDELNETDAERQWYKFNQYVNLFKRELHPSMFIPWDKENNCPLEKPENPHPFATPQEESEYEDVMKQYQQAESEVIFEGCKASKRNGFYEIYNTKGFWLTWQKDKTIEDIHKHVELNDNGKKLGGL